MYLKYFPHIYIYIYIYINIQTRIVRMTSHARSYGLSSLGDVSYQCTRAITNAHSHSCWASITSHTYIYIQIHIPVRQLRSHLELRIHIRTQYIRKYPRRCPYHPAKTDTRIYVQIRVYICIYTYTQIPMCIHMPIPVRQPRGHTELEPFALLKAQRL